MNEYLEQHKVTLTVRGPVFVGNGKELKKKEYLFLPGGKIGILDIGKLYRLLQSKGRAKGFEQFMLADGRSDLRRWLEQERLLNDVSRGCLKYVLEQDRVTFIKGPLTVMEFIKDAYGNPYVPGSTLKGMLRGILMSNRLLEDDNLRSHTQGELRKNISYRRKSYLSNVCDYMEGKTFRTLGRKVKPSQEAVNDVMLGFIVSDSSPIDIKQLVLARKVEYNIHGGTKALNLLRESLRPGTKISFTITVDKKLFPNIKERLLKSIENFDNVYNDSFLCKFSGMDFLQFPQVFVGGGAGFVSKTVLYPLMGKEEGLSSAVEIFRQTGVPMKHNHHKDKGLGVSPHILKCTWYGGRTLQMGLCDFSME